ncbi:cysteine hydrolase family protein [Pararhodobacter sp.]|uniref:cysteine hydrolase family protein n=1 Tax=Pararhodobacter sp. TaxID=2127056 RepID=UPI002FDE5023
MPPLNARPEPVTPDTARTALIVVDMQNAFASKGGMFDLAGHDISGAGPVIDLHKRLLPAVRAAGVQVIYLQMSFKPDLSDAGGPDSPAYHKELALRMMRERPELAGTLLIDDSWDGQIVDGLAPQDGDIVIRKSRYNGFTGTDLDAVLKARGIRHLLFTGIATNICVESTARNAFFNEYWPILIADAMNHAGPDFTRQATLWNFENVLGWVTESGAVFDWLAAR